MSASPELFLARRGRRVWTMPIKGTRPLGGAGLAEAEKDRAEHMMIVDLERNDLSRVCEPGSVRWPELMVERELAGVVHLVSTVEGTLRPDVGLAELLEATFPGGSVTGAPKIAAVDHIAALEPVGRGASMGALGRIWPNGDLELALTIRTFAIAEDTIHLWVGGGIVWDSEPEAEIEESWVKARPLLDALRRVTVLALAVAGRGLVDPDEPAVHADDEAVLRGRAAFETMRVYGGVPFRLEAHLVRLAASCERIGVEPPDPDEARELAALALSDAQRAGGDAALLPDVRTRASELAAPAGHGQLAARTSRRPARARDPPRLAARRSRRSAVAARRSEVDELRDEHGGRGGSACARRGRRRVRHRRRARAGRARDEPLVAARLGPVHAVPRPRSAGRRDA